MQNAFWRTFSKGKCSAVQKCMLQKCKRVHFPKECIFAAKQNVTNAFDAKMHFDVQKCI